MARPKKEPLKVISVKLTPAAVRLLQQLSREASDALGRPVSSSAVVRGLLEYVRQQPPAWPATHLHPVIEQEIIAGRVWGSKKQTPYG
jgi:hypothetical protein